MLLEGREKYMKWELLADEKLDSIVGGEYITAAGVMALVSVMAMLIAAYKIYLSSKGKATFPNGYSFEWS